MASCMEDWDSVVFCLDLVGFFPSALREIPKESFSCQRAVVLHKMWYRMCRMQGCCCADVVLRARLTAVLPGLRWETLSLHHSHCSEVPRSTSKTAPIQTTNEHPSFLVAPQNQISLETEFRISTCRDPAML